MNYKIFFRLQMRRKNQVDFKDLEVKPPSQNYSLLQLIVE